MQSRTYKSFGASRVVPMLATSVVLLALLGDRTFLRKEPPQAKAYHQAVSAAAEQLPKTFGPWLGVDIEVPVAAVKMLHPNVIISRRYQNITTSQGVTVLLVHVKDARDLLGHYPPVCYAGQGWKIQSTEAVRWSMGDKPLDGTEYRFERGDIQGGTHIVVDNFFVMRGGVICRSMDDVELAAQDRQRKFFGAAQVQFVHDGAISPQRRRESEQELLKILEPTLAAISAEGRA